ncbi:MAG: hypothetical protein JXA64_05620 [Candidatus Fermentibacteraceae bacterium]|nr:hypothetical protein [Candidatus Fermentibacteraceae bacterium]MBN2608575.1 hypothetical protein [Candidatus Fermentibacteraceae bacterium]
MYPNRSMPERRAAGVLLLAALAMMFTAMSCIDDPPTHPEINEYRSFLDLVWELYDQKYVGFDSKNVDWEGIHQQYSDMAAGADSTDELMEVVVAMVGELEDRNAFLAMDGSVVPTFSGETRVNFDYSVLMEYLEPWNFQWDSSFGVTWGSCVIDSIPYFAIKHFNYFFTYMHFRDEFITHLESPGMILDLRMSDDFSLVPAEQLPGLFTDQSMVAFLTQYRTGPSHDDISQLESHNISPISWAFLKPVVILAGQQNFGPSEAFLSVMERMPHVTIIGDTTGGGANTPGYMNQQYWPVWDFWDITCPFARFLTADTVCIEGVGIIPDIHVQATEEAFAAGEDPVLEYAIQWIGEATSPQ